LGRVLDEDTALLRPGSGARRGASSVHAASTASECDWAAAHGPHAQPDADGHYCALASHAGIPDAVAAADGSRGDRDADDGGATACERGQRAARLGPGKVCGARLGMEAALRWRHP